MRWFVLLAVLACAGYALLVARQPRPSVPVVAPATTAAPSAAPLAQSPRPEVAPESDAVPPEPAPADGGEGDMDPVREPERRAIRDKLCAKDPECCSYDADESPRDLTTYQLDANAQVLVLSCSTFGYNPTESVWVAAAGGEPVAARFAALPEGLSLGESPAAPPAPDAAKSWLTTPVVHDGHLSSTFCMRGLCDAGTEVEYVWRDQQFHVARVRDRGDDCCAELESVGDWPIVWPDHERCAYRWQVREGSVELVTLMAQGERVDAVPGLPASCSVDESGQVLTCAENYVPVTSDSDHWVLWQRTGTDSDPGAPRIRARLVRGCPL